MFNKKYALGSEGSWNTIMQEILEHLYLNIWEFFVYLFKKIFTGVESSEFHYLLYNECPSSKVC